MFCFVFFFPLLKWTFLLKLATQSGIQAHTKPSFSRKWSWNYSSISGARLHLLKALGPYPEEGFESSCACRCSSWMGMEAPAPTRPLEPRSPQWGPDANPRAGDSTQHPWGLPMPQGLGACCGEAWLQHSSLPPVPRVICYSFLPESPDAGLGSCREWMDASPGVSLPLLSPQRAYHFCGLFWDPFHFCNSLGYAEQKGQITPLQNEIVMALLFPSLVCA